MKYWPFFLFFLPLAATVNEPLRIALYSGYRNDRLHWHLQQGGTGTLTYSELYRDVQFWENGITLQAIHRDLAFFLQGSYGAFGKGSLFERYANLSFTPTEPRFRFDTNGWAADASGYFSYAVNLTANRTYKVILLPLVGYSAHFEQLRRLNCSPNPFEGNGFTMSSSLPGSLHSTWYGFFLGAGFTIEPGNGLFFHGGYSYHWLEERFKTQFQNTVLETTTYSFKAHGDGNIGQTGWGEVTGAIGRFWRIGLGAKIHYFSSVLLPTKLHQETDSTSDTISQKLKVRWTPISGWFTVSRQI